jgi:phosphopantetheinyl transferase (holo-ACP synthase)
VAALGIGVDVVDIGRITASVDRRQDALARRLLNGTERAWVDGAPDPVVGLAVCLGLKEAAIKALGGRPPGFAWPDLARDEPATMAPPAWLVDIVGALGAGDVEFATIGGRPGAWGVVADTIVAVVATDDSGATIAAARVAIAGDTEAGDLTAAELEYAGSSAERRAGRRAARAAVLQLPGLEDAVVETLPGVHPPTSTRPCRGGSHPPRVLVNGRDSDVRVTISHGQSAAVAVAWRA